MKKMKKIMALFLAMAMVLGMSMTTFAAGENPDPANPSTVTVTGTGTADDNTKGVITVKGIEDGATVTAYQIIAAKYENEYNGVGHFSGYKSLYDAITVPENGSAPEITVENLTAVVEHLNFQGGVADPTKLAAGTTAISMTGDSANGYTASKVAVGSYLVVVTNAKGIYNPLVLSVYYDNNGNDLDVTNPTLDITSVVGWAKASSSPTVDKKVQKDGQEVKSVNIGDTVEYRVEIGPIPYYKGQYPVFTVEDTVGKGLKINADSVKIKTKATKEAEDSTAVEFTGVTPVVTETTLTANFVGDAGYLLNDYQGQYLLITYTATVTDKDAINYDPYTNTATLKYTNDSNVDKGDHPDETDDKTYNYTFDLGTAAEGSIKESILTKTGVDEKNETIKLEGAEFTLYTNADCTTVYTNAFMEDGKVVSGANGELIIRGLAEGSYWLKETKAPQGYSLNEKAFPIVIKAEYYEEADGEELAGQLKSWTISFDGKDVIKGGVTIADGVVTGGTLDLPEVDQRPTIPNTKLASLPSTGGIGTTIFTIGGCAIMIIAAGLYFASRRRAAK